MLSRRRFVSTISSSAVLAACGKSLLAQSANPAVFSPGYLGAFQQGLLTYARFQSLVGSGFHLYLPDNTIEITLTHVSSAQETIAAMPTDTAAKTSHRASLLAAVAPREQNFTVHFSTGNASVPQDTYVVDHGTLGRFALFLVTGGSPGNYNVAAGFYNLSAGVNPSHTEYRMTAQNLHS